MSSINTAGVGQGVSLYLQALTANAQTQRSRSKSAAKPSGEAAASSGSSRAIPAGHQSNQGVGALFQQLQSAVTSALTLAKSGGTAANPHQLVQDAISQVIKGRQNGGKPGSSAGSESDAPAATGNGSGSNTSDLEQVLQSTGVNVRQFQADFLSAVTGATQGKAPAAASAFAGFSTGSTLDTYA